MSTNHSGVFKPFIITRDRDNKFRVKLYDKQGFVLAYSEGYNRKASAKRCIYRTLYLEREGQYTTFLRLVKDNDSDNNPTFHLCIMGRNQEIVMHSPSVRHHKVGEIAAKIMAITDSFDPDTQTGSEFYEDNSYLKPRKEN